MQAADRLIIPLQADGYNIQSLYQTIDTARQIQASNHRLQIGFIITDYDTRTKMSKQVQHILINKGTEAGAQYLGTIRHGVAIGEAALFRESLYKHAPRSNPARDYIDIFNAITKNKYI